MTEQKKELARLLRFVPASELPPDQLTIFDAANNLLLINKDLFDELDPIQQREVIHTTKNLALN